MLSGRVSRACKNREYHTAQLWEGNWAELRLATGTLHELSCRVFFFFSRRRNKSDLFRNKAPRRPSQAQEVRYDHAVAVLTGICRWDTLRPLWRAACAVELMKSCSIGHGLCAEARRRGKSSAVPRSHAWLGVSLALSAFFFCWLWSCEFGSVLARSHCPSRGPFQGPTLSHLYMELGYARNHTTSTWARARPAVGNLHRRAVRRWCMNS